MAISWKPSSTWARQGKVNPPQGGGFHSTAGTSSFEEQEGRTTAPGEWGGYLYADPRPDREVLCEGD